MRTAFFISSIVVVTVNVVLAFVFPAILWSLLLFAPLIALGLYDSMQSKRAVLRNFPLIGHFRYLFESIRPEIAQYFIETDTSGRPFPRIKRSVVYQRAKQVRDTIPFGTQFDLYEVGYEWVNHSMQPLHLKPEDLRTTVGGPECGLPYSASIFNISAMSYGSLSSRAIRALNLGARMGNFAHNTGEGGISPYHLQGGDLIWQIGTGYFGCRLENGRFCPDRFSANAGRPEVKMIEIKLSQGAKPGHGGILPASKVSPEIAKIRGVALGQDVLSPPSHSAFDTPIELLEFIALLRRLSGGKPIGFKLCLGKRREFLSICKAMRETGISPDFITIDGGEGGTGAAPVEFSNHIGAPLMESLIFVHNALKGFALRDSIRLIASGKVTTGFDMVKRLALGADMLYSARGMMMALGCIQALQCNSNHCPVGVATQNPQLVAGLVVEHKSKRVANFHRETVASVSEIMGAMGIDDPDKLHPWHIMRRTTPTEVKHYGEIFEFLEEGELLRDDLPGSYRRACEAARSDTFAHIADVPSQPHLA